VKFSPEGGTIEVRTFSNSADGLISIEIKDQGVGIAPEKLVSIFDAFEQGARHSHSGLGLGLAICKALVEMHNGHISAQSEGVDRGASFIIQLPCTLPIKDEHPQETENLPPHHGLRLLVVEDHRDTLSTLERLLTRHGYEVRTAASIAESLKVAKEYQFDVLVSDIGLPDGRGTELLQKLEVMLGQRPPSVAMSGFGMDEDLERSRDAGFSEHLIKPVEFPSLHKAIVRVASLAPVS
jgi:CheY-like chemotaxis protein